MLAILVYDVNEKRVMKINRICSKYLFWNQNSVFVGNINKTNLLFLENELEENINILEDHILIFLFSSNVKFKIKEIGIKRYESSKIYW